MDGLNWRKDMWNSAFYQLSKQRHLYAIKGGFVFIMPLMVMGAFTVLVNELPIKAYQDLLVRLFGVNWVSWGSYIQSATFSIVALAATMSISSSLASWYRTHSSVDITSVQASLVSLACFILVCMPQEGFFTEKLTGSTGLFVAILVSLSATELLIFFLNWQPIKLYLFVDEPDRRVGQSFDAIMPSVCTITLFSLVRLVLITFDLPPLNELLYNFLQLPLRGLGNSPFTAVLTIFMTHLLWLFGINGKNALDQVVTDVFQPALASNATMAITHAEPQLFTKTFFDAFVYMGGAGATICLIIALSLFARRSGQERLSRISALTVMFNINEMLLYGLPIIFNPVYIIPFVLTPLCALAISSLATLMGLMPYTTVAVSSATPILFSGYISTGGSWSAVLVQAVSVAAGVFIYKPFIQISERLRKRRFNDAYAKLRELCEEDFTAYEGKKFINRDDEVGAVARLLAIDIKQALNNRKEMYYLYQPLIGGEHNNVVGAEELLRWKHPLHGPISPMVIVALCEDLGLSRQLGQMALSSACRELKRWRESGVNDAYVSVNVSSTELREADFASRMIMTTKQYDVLPSSIQIEVTESLAVSHDEITKRNLDQVREMGFGVAIDDFGMGHSSLVYLQRFPFSTLKVDKSLSKEVSTSPENLEIISSILQLCRSLGIGMVVEYVENDWQLSLLRSVGCNQFQGYHFSPPITSEEFCSYYIRSRKREQGKE